jgi:hypothetical protein
MIAVHRHCARNRAAMSTRASGLPATARPGSAARISHVRCSNSPSNVSGRKRVRDA